MFYFRNSRFLYTLLAFAVLAAFALPADGQDKSQLIKTKTGSGTLTEKLVVTSSNAMIRSGVNVADQSEPIPAFSILWRLKVPNTNDNESSGFYRVGDNEGKEIGWIKKADVTSWPTRFCLEPMPPQEDRAFTVYADQNQEKVLAKNSGVAVGNKQLAFITSATDNKTEDAPQKVLIYTGPIDSGSASSKEKMQVANMELEIVFVIDTTLSMEPMIELAKNVTRKTIQNLLRDEQLKQIVHFGLVEYRDKAGSCEFDARVACSLKQSNDQFSQALDALKCDTMEDNDIPEEVVCGLLTAINEAGWRENSSKHIILLGDAPNKEGKILNDAYQSSTSETISSIVNKARPQGGSEGVKAFKSINFHAICNNQKSVVESIIDSVEAKGEEADSIRELFSNPKVIAMGRENPEALFGVMSRIFEDEEAAKAITIAILRNDACLECTRTAQKQFEQLSRNNGEVQGYYRSIDTYKNDGSEEDAIKELTQALNVSYQNLAKARQGDTDLKVTSGSAGSIAQGIYQIVKSNLPEGEGGKDVLQGYAKTYDANGRQVAFQKVLIMKKELRRFASVMDSLHGRFEKRSSKAARQDITAILEDLKEGLAQAATSDEISEEMNLQDIIEQDFPLKTDALNVSAKSIAAMTVPAFNAWLESIAKARDRAYALLDSTSDWTTLNKTDQTFTFLKLSELP